MMGSIKYIFLMMGSLYCSVFLCKGQRKAATEKLLDKMAIAVPASANRCVSFTNSEAAFYFTQSHITNHPEYAWFEGMNIAKNRVFGGYNVYAGHQLLNPIEAKVNVYPYKLVRHYTNHYREELWMLDHRNILEINLTGGNLPIGISLKGNGVSLLHRNIDIAYFSPMEGQFVIAVSAKNGERLKNAGDTISAGAHAGGFYIAVGKTEKEAANLISSTRKNITTLQKERMQHMQDFLQQNTYTHSNIDSFNLAMNWLETTMNQLVTHQQGYGIYAGLPWFNEYWGRDEFISMPGAVLVSGQFATAKKILESFAAYQQTDSTSPFFGRVPNIVNPREIDYHTTDGTPRFLIELQDYVKYSGDTAIIPRLYTNIKYSIEGPLKYHVDAKGYLLHADNETWMDARDKNLVSYSPRGSRANDIQALWYEQLCAGVYFARYMKDKANEEKWQQIADNVKQNFEKDFSDKDHDFLADRLTTDNKADFTLRPNQLFALDMITNTDLKYHTIKKAWEELVYPWGVATLDRHNPFFHPFHLTPDYPKDEAYHNGTVWPWLNGIAMQRMIEAGQVETAYKLFRNMNRQALQLGVVGGLGENLDAYPHKGKTWPNLTGTYLQAWSNAEQLRIWYQYFLGIRPDMANHRITIAPRIPEEIKDLNYNAVTGNGFIKGSYRVQKGSASWAYQFNNISATLSIDIYPYAILEIKAEPGTELRLRVEDHQLIAGLYNREGKRISEQRSAYAEARVNALKNATLLLQDIPFARPLGWEMHPIIKTY